MRWAFWRKKTARRAEPDRSPDAEPPGPRPLPPWAPPGGRSTSPDEPDPDSPPTPAFSGATPDPGGGPEALGGAEPAADGGAAGFPDVDLAAVREDVADLVRAALARDAAGLSAVLERVSARGPDAPGMTSIAALSALGDRLAVMAGFAPGEEPTASATAAAVIAQGDTVAGRAGPLLRAGAPDAPRGLVRFAVRVSCGAPEADADAQPAAEDALIRVAAVLLAQTVLDGAGDVDALAAELAELLPG